MIDRKAKGKVMKAWVIDGIVSRNSGVPHIRLKEMPEPEPEAGQVKLRVHACGICHTELDEIEGRTPPANYPMVPGHQVVGTVSAVGRDVDASWIGQRVGVAWIAGACGTCTFCLQGMENLCPSFIATGRDKHGGYAPWLTILAQFIHPIPVGLGDAEAAPLLCAGAIGYRSLKLTGLKNNEVLGLTGFGASGHQVLKLARVLFPDSPVQVFARDAAERELALSLGAIWAGDINDVPPHQCDAIIDTTPAWRPVIQALRSLAPGGRLVINAIRKEAHDMDALLELDYARDLWMEKVIRSVANITRADVREFLSLAARHRLVPLVTTYAFHQADEALRDLATGKGKGAKVLVVEEYRCWVTLECPCWTKLTLSGDRRMEMAGRKLAYFTEGKPSRVDPRAGQ